MQPTRDKNGYFHFKDYPSFQPNLSPQEIFELGSFGGTYWRPIYSTVTAQHYKNIHKKYPFLVHIPEEKLTTPYDKYNADINYYGVKVGTTLQFWESKHWISKYNPYGWVHWYCDFFSGRRTPDDERQIARWQRTAGPNSRFRLWLIHQVRRKRAAFDEYSIAPKIRQTLQQWGYMLSEQDFKSAP
jgi:hypothetical protein